MARFFTGWHIYWGGMHEEVGAGQRWPMTLMRQRLREIGLASSLFPFLVLLIFLLCVCVKIVVFLYPPLFCLFSVYSVL